LEDVIDHTTVNRFHIGVNAIDTSGPGFEFGLKVFDLRSNRRDRFTEPVGIHRTQNLGRGGKARVHN